MTDERLYQEVQKLFTYIDSLQKLTSSTDAKINAHLDVSEVRVKNYDETLKRLNNEIDANKKKINELMSFKVDHESRWKGVLTIGAITSMIFTILGIIAYLKVFSK